MLGYKVFLSVKRLKVRYELLRNKSLREDVTRLCPRMNTKVKRQAQTRVPSCYTLLICDETVAGKVQIPLTGLSQLSGFKGSKHHKNEKYPPCSTEFNKVAMCWGVLFLFPLQKGN